MLTKIERITEISILLLIFTLTSLRSFVFWVLFPDTHQIFGLAWREIIIWLLLLLLVFYIMHKRGLSGYFLMNWGKYPILILFIFYALISVFWSVTWTGTLYRSLGLLFTTIAALYLSRRYSLEEFLQVLFWVSVVTVSASFILVIVWPNLGTDLNPPYNGAWRGIFWHKNHLGNVIPIFNLIFLLRIFQSPIQSFRFGKITAGIFYILSLILIYQAKSASGYILLLLLHFVFFISVVWVRIYRRLTPSHYWIMLIVFLAGSILVFSNLELIFGLFNREITLTGRVPLWGYLLSEVFLERPLFGYGFGSLWTMESFRLSTQDFIGWGYQVMIGDNGFLDILLNGGIVGLTLFLVVYLQTWIVSIRYSLAVRSLVSMFPLIFMLYTLFVNLSFSMFLETESLIWMICIYLLFLEIPSAEKI